MIVRQILVEDLSKIYYFKKRYTPKLPKYVDLPSEFEDSMETKLTIET